MSLPGMGGPIMAGSASAYSLTVGSGSIDLGKGGSVTADGYANGDPTYGTFGSLTPTTWGGFTIRSIYNISGTTYLIVSGDAHLLSPVLTAGGANQNLGAGTYSAPSTTFSGTASDPFASIGATIPVGIS